MKDTFDSEMQKPPIAGHHCVVQLDIPHIDMCTIESSEISTLHKQASLLWSQCCPCKGGFPS